MAPLLLVLAVGTGCERAAEKSAESAAEGWIGEQGREAEVEIDRTEGSILIDLGGVRRPSKWPEDVPLDAETVVARVRNGEKGAASLELRSRKPPERLASDYRRAIVDAGWAVEATGDPGEVRARKGRRLLMATFAESRGVGESRARIEVVEGPG